MLEQMSEASTPVCRGPSGAVAWDLGAQETSRSRHAHLMLRSLTGSVRRLGWLASMTAFLENTGRRLTDFVLHMVKARR